MKVEPDTAQVAADAGRVLDVVRGGGGALIYLDLGYALVAHTPLAVRHIYAAKGREFTKPMGLVVGQRIKPCMFLMVKNRIRCAGRLQRCDFGSIADPVRSDIDVNLSRHLICLRIKSPVNALKCNTFKALSATAGAARSSMRPGTMCYASGGLKRNECQN